MPPSKAETLRKLTALTPQDLAKVQTLIERHRVQRINKAARSTTPVWGGTTVGWPKSR